MRSKKKLAIFLVAILAFVGIVFATNTASANGEECVPKDAWTEVIEHPAVTHEETIVVVDKEAWTEVIPAVAEIWANFQPKNHKEPFVGPPSYPVDERGSWNNHTKIPGGHEGPDGVYSKGDPSKGGNWFYRRNGVEEQIIEHPAVTHEETIVVVDKEAWTETIEHPAVTCPQEPEEPQEPEVPETPVVDKPKPQPQPPVTQPAPAPAPAPATPVVAVPTSINAGL